MILPTIKIEKELQAGGMDIVIGVDEVGRGPLAGPVVAGACWINPLILEEEFENRNLIRDSKKLSEKQRNKIHKFILESDDFILGIGEVSVETIDKINILNASLVAMRLAVDEVIEQVKSHPASLKLRGIRKSKVKNKKVKRGKGFASRRTGAIAEGRERQNLEECDTTVIYQTINKNKICILIDGNKNIPNLDFEQRLFAKGDQRIFSIAVASIYAKVYRDSLMEKYDKEFPDYGFAQHKGYGTKLHIEQLNKFGACAIHRRSFSPVRKILE